MACAADCVTLSTERTFFFAMDLKILVKIVHTTINPTDTQPVGFTTSFTATGHYTENYSNERCERTAPS